MAYHGGSLASLFGAGPQAATKQAALKMSAKGADRWHEVTAMNTPVRTGNLRTAWYTTPPVEVGYVIAVGYRSGVHNDVKYAPYVEYGTGIYGPKHRPYPITPKDPNGMLAWRDPVTGRWVFAKKVMHPGSPGNHMLAIAAHVVEARRTGGVLMQGVLDEWARAVRRFGEIEALTRCDALGEEVPRG
jgi:hypothetical protein